ncbi:FtsH protease activity modulator HflK [SAR202 cluster bacterium AC-409-J13_OGT_754m]|nr:FtsH protease activity modulator HflK [SAR202 cluster bacterium AC-409-J13_OGT_754m]
MFESGRGRGDFDPEKILRQIVSALQNFRIGAGSNNKAMLLIVVVGIIWLGTGVYSVNPGEQSVMQLFGKTSTTAGPGLHWYWPNPIGTKNVESIEQIKTMELGIVREDAQMITGDLNIADVSLVVQYRIKNLEYYLFNVDDPGDSLRDTDEGEPDGITLKDATESALRLVVGQRSIDGILTSEKEEVQNETQILLQSILDTYFSGIQVLTVRLQEVKPPDEVRDAFDDVLRARQDQDTKVNQAKAYREDILPRAQGEATQLINEAGAYKAEVIALAEGEAKRFLAVLEEYKKAKDVTRYRLYLEAMESILIETSIFAIDPQSGNNLLEVLPLSPLTTSDTQPPNISIQDTESGTE